MMDEMLMRKRRVRPPICVSDLRSLTPIYYSPSEFAVTPTIMVLRRLNLSRATMRDHIPPKITIGDNVQKRIKQPGGGIADNK